MTLFSVTASQDDVVRPEDVQRILDATQVIEVRLDEVHAGPVRRLTESMNVQVDVGEPQFGQAEDQDRILVRFTHTITVNPEDAVEELTSLKLSHVVVVEVRERLETTWPAIAMWIETNVYFLAYPYVRQSVSSLTATMGMPALMLGYLNREDRPFTRAEQ